MRRLFVLLFSLNFILLIASTESEKHGTPSKNFEKLHNADGHQVDMDHQAVLGSKKMAHEFDDLSPQESKRRLRVIAGRMDKNGDGSVSLQELTDWVYNSLIQLDAEETVERFEEIDKDHDGKVTWSEYVQESFGTEDTAGMDAEYAKLMNEDRAYFDAADLNKDGILDAEEFKAFQNPEHHPHMHATLVKNTLGEKDTNKDGKIDLREFLGEIHEQPQSEFYLTEKSRFADEYDKNKDGFLADEELRQWLIPDIHQTAHDEAEHLISTADENKDGKLSIDEIVDSYTTFVGSEATNFGEQLSSVRHEEL
ncbi:hypothetical protein M3Y98_00500500 [Aphelenchoides besseyi]|nr:hypothetical protein M3Y98_00500500 [Aphelenchoides besseyi]KAI6207757.1 hypothetical protein M3Y96_00042700 [Aphelenchoides besseyi]